MSVRRRRRSWRARHHVVARRPALGPARRRWRTARAASRARPTPRPSRARSRRPGRRARPRRRLDPEGAQLEAARARRPAPVAASRLRPPAPGSRRRRRRTPARPPPPRPCRGRRRRAPRRPVSSTAAARSCRARPADRSTRITSSGVIVRLSMYSSAWTLSFRWLLKPEAGTVLVTSTTGTWPAGPFLALLHSA